MKVSTYSVKDMYYKEVENVSPLGIKVELSDGTKFDIGESTASPGLLCVRLSDGSIIEVQPGAANVVYIHRSNIA